jgi:hypothetical protein
MIFGIGTCSRVRKEGFSKSVRVKKPIEFQRIMVKGAKSRGRNLVLYRLQGMEGQRFGIRTRTPLPKMRAWWWCVNHQQRP